MTVSWWVSDGERLLFERRSIEQLETSATWLHQVKWYLHDQHLNCEAVIHAHGHDYTVRLEYPKYFPTLCPAVIPVDDQRRWSGHQYGAGGTLCLEIRPDNWDPAFTGADMLESAFKLLSTENPLGFAEAGQSVVASAHQETLADLVKQSDKKFFASETFKRKVLLLPNFASVVTSSVYNPITKVFTLRSARFPDTQIDWNDESVPQQPEASDLILGFALKTPFPSHLLGNNLSFSDLRSALAIANLTHWPHLPDQPITSVEVEGLALLVDADGLPHAYFFNGKTAELSVTSLFVIPDDRTSERQSNRDKMSQSTVGIFGAGSLGSKVAISLARSGVGKIFAVDSDVLLPGNLSRHALDWIAVGGSKVKGLETAINMVNPETSVIPLNALAGGQISAEHHRIIMEALMSCDVVVDATGNPQAFNLLAELTAAAEKPLVWGLVYGGGIGGLIARSRPGLDPSALCVRGVYNAYTQEHPAEPSMTDSTGYAFTVPGEEPLIASDADVSVIAAHVSNMTLDLLQTTESIYPNSLYLVGLRPGWVFEQPFHVIPIQVPPSTEWPDPPQPLTNLSPQEIADHFQFCEMLLEIETQ